MVDCVALPKCEMSDTKQSPTNSYYKFVNSLLEGEDLKTKLLETGEKELVEASPMDKVKRVLLER
jgi:hypothetical protein